MSRGFRVWDETKKQYDEIHNYFLSQEGILWRWSTLLDDERLQGLPENLFVVEFDTGLKDKNGKKIYEGDIAKVYAWTNLTRGMEYRHTTKVFWQERYAQFNTTYNDALSNEITQDYFEVIGNVHDNPELLEGEK